MSIEPAPRALARAANPVTAAAIAAAALCIAALGLFWPGVAMYDTVAQYRQVLSGVYDDWHPPTMARFWALVAPLARGAVPMLVVQLATYWLGLGLIAAALVRIGRLRSAVAILFIGVLPPFLGWQGVVLKDAQLVGALLAAIGLIGWWRLRSLPIPRFAVAAIALLVAYALMVRANAVFAAIPLAVMLAPRPAHPAAKVLAALVATLAVLGVAPIVNHSLLGAQPSGVERTQALYDLAGIAARVPDGSAIGLTPAEVRTIIARNCASSYFWDPLGDDTHCGLALARLRILPVGTLYATLATAVLHHPVAYAAHRLAHLNSTDRWLVPLRWPGAAPSAFSEPNTLGLGSPGAAARGWQAMTAVVIETPLGWPIVWIVAALTAFAVVATRRRDPAQDLASALLISALILEASFAVLSIASDLRYHLWAMIATALAIVLLANRPPPRRIMQAGAVAMLLVVGIGIVARVTLPAPPQTYVGMLG